MDHYAVLGVAPDADAATVRRAYVAAARRHHPDFHASADAATRADHARRMQAVNAAWSVLSDPASRERYDLTLPGAAPPRQNPWPSTRPEPQMPAGKGWTPRADDTAWQEDFGAWAAESDRPPIDLPASRRRSPLAVLPVLLFASGVLTGFVGMAMSSRPLMSAAFIFIALSACLFIMLPVLAMTRGRHRD